MLWHGYWSLKSSTDKHHQVLNSLTHLELVVDSNILLPVKVSHGDLQLVILLAGQSVEVVKAKPALS